MFNTSIKKKRAVGIFLLTIILIVFLSFNRFPKLDAVGEDLEAINAPDIQCFQGFCIKRDTGDGFYKQWLTFSITYLRLVSVGMTFAFVVAGLSESFLFPTSAGRTFQSGGVFKRTITGLAAGPVLNLCSACIVPISTMFKRKGGGIEGAISMVQGSATLNIPALAMVFFVFTPLLGFSRLILALLGGLILGPLVAYVIRKSTSSENTDEPDPLFLEINEESTWKNDISEGFRDWAKTSIGYLLRMGPMMVIAGFASGLIIQWLNPSIVTKFLGNDITGVIIASTIGILINVPLLFEIPLVALLILLGMGTAPAAALLFTAAGGGPLTFWGLSKIMPKKGISTFALGTWSLGLIGGLGILMLGNIIWEKALQSVPIAKNIPLVSNLAEESIYVEITDQSNIKFDHHNVLDQLIAMGGGTITFHANDDNLPDIYVVDSEGPNHLYINNGNGTFTETARKVGLNDTGGRGNGACAADYDNDGDQDIYVTNYGNSKLFENQGNTKFNDVSDESKVSLSDGQDHRATGCAWGDYNQDGFLDLIVLRHAHEGNYYMLQEIEFKPWLRRLALFTNNGDGTFIDSTQLLGDIRGPKRIYKDDPFGTIWGTGFQPGWVDFDNDGDLDLYVVNDYGMHVQPNVLWRNDGEGNGSNNWIFTDISKDSGVDAAILGMGLAVGDYDLDGYFDFFITNIGNQMLFRNTGKNMVFEETTIEAGLEMSKLNYPGGVMDRVAWATMFFDYDNDGIEDLYIVSGFLNLHETERAFDVPPEMRLQPNVLMRNKGDLTFEDKSKISGADDDGIGRGGFYLDYNLDGCLDIFITNLDGKAKLFQNTCSKDNNWLIINPVGTVSNKDGIGTRIKIISNGKSQIREIAAGSSSMGQNMMEAHFGLGQAKTVDSITLNWPSGIEQTLTDVNVNQIFEIIEKR